MAGGRDRLAEGLDLVVGVARLGNRHIAEDEVEAFGETIPATRSTPAKSGMRSSAAIASSMLPSP